ncbi:uncharacterized protein [Antedon mediterranea]|uniref:uncharacterized protein n=1 Tax=Antedon mediterranea TaxID=105859 RepID=UPI003AF7E5B5
MNEIERSRCTKRSRRQIGDKNKSVLIALYEKGMSSYRSDRQKVLLAKAVEKTGLLEEQVKDWIGNYKKKLSGKKRPCKEKLRIRKQTGHQLFMSEHIKEELDKGRTYTDCRVSGLKKWQELKQSNESASYEERARLALPLPTTPSQMTEGQNKIAIARKTKEIEKKIQEMVNLGCQCIAVILHPNNDTIFSFGSEEGNYFMEREQLTTKFLSFSNGPNATQVNKKKKLRREVQELLNNKFKQASGKDRVPYKEVMNGKWRVCGLDPIGFKPIGRYTYQELESIIEKSNHLKFEATENETVLADVTENETVLADATDNETVLADGKLNIIYLIFNATKQFVVERCSSLLYDIVIE